ncbi:alpha/beta hydrolase [Aquitalea sp. LB_tupeE]|uniref:alpha/beta hydrolase n=1 Tax=Aquitalea sp. LB_tupeE TaxID=2748078 RepID=UPI0015BED795|nr:alpha/beta hydrolase [Aquitalea sp. LB_tupeE]NWK77540.1 alpha/beta hydrolase [Aquitalea sp. LB_tupeE]
MKHMLTALLLFCCGAAQAQEQMLTLETRPSVTLRLLLLEPHGKPQASLILFTGGEGMLRLGDDGRLHAGAGNFLVRTRQQWAAQGFQVAVVDAPSDHPDNLNRADFRMSAEHAQDIAVVIDTLRQRAAVPVWLVGTSRGTTSAAAVAIRLQGKVDGVVLTSTINRDRGSVADLALPQLTQPVLVVQHLHDQCKVTLYQNVQPVMDGLQSSRSKEMLLVDGGVDKGDPCQPWAAHGYNGIESEVVEKVARWIHQH